MVGIVLTFIVWLNYEKNKSSKLDKQNSINFWEKESKANLVKRQSLELLDYIKLPLDIVSFENTMDETLQNFHKEYQQLSNKQIVNLTGISNTELKMSYGAPNLPVLTEYDQNFTNLARLLYEWSSYLLETDNEKDAKALLEFGVQCKTDISKHYSLLANIYKKNGELSKIQSLISEAENINSLMKTSIINNLKSILAE